MDEDPLLEAAIAAQILLERIKESISSSFVEVFTRVGQNLSTILAKGGEELTAKSRRAVSKDLKLIESNTSKVITAEAKALAVELSVIAGVFAAKEAQSIISVVSGGASINTITAKQAYNLAKVQAMAHSGETLEEFIGRLSGTESRRVVGVVRRGYFQGKTNNQIIGEIIGTRAANFKNGILEVSRRNASATVRTSIQHVANVGRARLWEANAGVVTGYEWLAVLDSRTSTRCRSLDGQKFELGKGPIPPIHINCRSTTVPVLKPEFDSLLEGEKRSSEFGPVDSKFSYYEWLKKQKPAYQDSALGKTRAKLFRDGGMSAERFSELNLDKNFNPLTLEQMKVLEPGAFKLAGL